MKIALYLNPQTTGPEMDAAHIRSCVEAAVAADEAGFSAIWLTEHHFTNYNTYADSMILAANLMPRLRQAWVVLTVVTLALHNPIRFAERCNLLDQLAEGRFIAGYGAGGSQPEFAGFGRDLEGRHELVRQNLDILERAWALEQGQPPLHYETAHESGTVHGRIMPVSHRRPHPLLARGTLHTEGIVDAARRGHVLLMGRLRPDQAAEQLALYRAELAAAGHDAELVETLLDHSGPARMMFVADSDEEAHELVQGAIDTYLSFSKSGQPADRGEKAAVGNTRVFTERADLLDRAIIWGGPDKVVAELKKFEATGLRQFTTWFSWGGISPERAARNQRIFAEHVLPHFETTHVTVGV